MEQVATPEVPAAPAAQPAAPADDQNALADKSAEPEAPAQPEEPETEERKQSRAARRWNRMRDRAIAAETELRILREQQGRSQPAGEPRQAQQPVDDAPKREQFDSYEDFIRADATYRAEKAADARARKVLEESRRSEHDQRSRAEQEKALKAWNAKLESARDEIDDFDDVCAESEATITQPMADAIRDSDKSGHLAYYLAKNPQEAERISKLSPSKQVAAIVALEDKVAKPAKSPSKAPAPISPGSGKAEAASDAPSDKDDIETWMRKEKARMEKAGVRL